MTAGQANDVIYGYLASKTPLEFAQSDNPELPEALVTLLYAQSLDREEMASMKIKINTLEEKQNGR